MSNGEQLDCEKCGLVFHRATLGPQLHKKTCAICEPPEQSLGKQGFRPLKVILVIALIIGGLFIQTCSYQRIAEVRQIARIPQTSVAAAIPGEVNLAGRARASGEGQILTAPHSRAQCLYYFYHKEREERDSDGDAKWVTVDKQTRFLPFDLRDGSGQIHLTPSEKVDFNIQKSYRRQIGRYRYTEHRIDPGDRLFVFGLLEQGDGAKKPQIVFDAPGDYMPIISEKSEEGERSSKSISSIWLCWLGLGLLAGASALSFWVLNLHRILLFFGILTLLISSVLFYQGLHMMRSDLLSAQSRIDRQEKVIKDLFSQELAQADAEWNGDWATLGELADYPKVPAKTRTKLRRVRIDFAVATRRVQAQRASFPYRWLAPFLKLTSPPEVPLSERDEKLLVKVSSSFQPAKISKTAGFIGAAIAAVFGVISFWGGFGTIKRKRLLENLPTTPSAGVSFGLTEVGGLVDLAREETALITPLSANPCTYFHYEIKERRGSGKNAKWVTIHSEVKQQTFLCRDQSGAIPIDPEGARVDCWQSSHKREGGKRHSEHFLRLGDPVHVIGYAKVDEQTGDSLLVGSPLDRGFKEAPFRLSAFCEEAIVRRGGVAASLILCVTFSALLFAGLMLFAAWGSFNPASYLAAALIGPTLMIIFAILLHYNDLIFLRERAKRAWSNIEVALQKRNDLIPALNEVAQTTLHHERDLQSDLAQLRVAKQASPQAADLAHTLNSTGATARRFIALAEDYPNLTASENFAQLAHQLATCENEIAFASVSFNDAVETYNTRIASLPDLFLAKTFRLKPFGQLQTKLETIALS